LRSRYNTASKTIVGKIMKGAVQVIMVSAAHRSAGVTTLCTSLATYLSEAHGTTLLADGETLVHLASQGVPPRRSMYREVKPGYIWVLGPTEHAQVTDVKDGAPVSADAVVTALKEHFDFVVIDTPAINFSSNAETLASAVDGSIFVAVPHTTECHEASRAGKRLTEAGGRLLGAVYNSAYQTFGTGA
jgi:Mrp family chromosome partitioning ATPase